MKFKFPKIIDDKDLFDELKVESKTLGKIRWINGTSPLYTINSIIKYDVLEHEILFIFKTYASLLSAIGSHEITITLLDSESVSQEYEMTVIFAKPL